MAETKYISELTGEELDYGLKHLKQSVTIVETKASEASNSAAAAAQSEANAAASESAAAESEQNAAASAEQAAAFKSAAAGSASAAASSETAAAASEAAAANSEKNAAQSADAAAAASTTALIPVQAAVGTSWTASGSAYVQDCPITYRTGGAVEATALDGWIITSPLYMTDEDLASSAKLAVGQAVDENPKSLALSGGQLQLHLTAAAAQSTAITVYFNITYKGA